MAARRLLIVLVLLLAASIVAASLAPERRSQLLPEDESTTTTTTAPAPAPQGDVISARIDASPKEPETVRASPGDQLELAVGVPSEPGQTIAIEEFGLTDFAAPGVPADFDLLLREQGEYPITDERGDVVGRLVVTADGRSGGPDDGGSDGPGTRPPAES